MATLSLHTYTPLTIVINLDTYLPIFANSPSCHKFASSSSSSWNSHEPAIKLDFAVSDMRRVSWFWTLCRFHRLNLTRPDFFRIKYAIINNRKWRYLRNAQSEVTSVNYEIQNTDGMEKLENVQFALNFYHNFVFTRLQKVLYGFIYIHIQDNSIFAISQQFLILLPTFLIYFADLGSYIYSKR